jgi:hypothetical protein
VRLASLWKCSTPRCARAQAPFTDRPEYTECERLAEQLADLLAPQSGAYYDVWLDGEKFVSSQIEVGPAPPGPRAPWCRSAPG